MGKYTNEIAKLDVQAPDSYRGQIAKLEAQTPSYVPQMYQEPPAPFTPQEKFSRAVDVMTPVGSVKTFGEAFDPETPMPGVGEMLLSGLDIGLTAFPPARAALAPVKAVARGAKPMTRGGRAARSLGRELATGAVAGGAALGASELSDNPLVALGAALAAGAPVSRGLSPVALDPDAARMIAQAEAKGIPLSPGAASPEAALREKELLSASPEASQVGADFYRAQKEAAEAGIQSASPVPLPLEVGAGSERILPELVAKGKKAGEKVGEARKAVTDLVKETPSEVVKSAPKAVRNILKKYGVDLADTKAPGINKSLAGNIRDLVSAFKVGKGKVTSVLDAKGNPVTKPPKPLSYEKAQRALEQFVSDADEFLSGTKGKKEQAVAMAVKSTFKKLLEGVSEAKAGGSATKAVKEAKREAAPILRARESARKILIDPRTKREVAAEDVLKTLTGGKFGKDITYITDQLDPKTLKKVRGDAAKMLLDKARGAEGISWKKLKGEMGKDSGKKLLNIMSKDQRKWLKDSADLLEWLEKPKTATGLVNTATSGAQTAKLAQLISAGGSVVSKFPVLKDIVSELRRVKARMYLGKGARPKKTSRIALPLVKGAKTQENK